jgi:anti-anti-sigma regulatory factor
MTEIKPYTSPYEVTATFVFPTNATVEQLADLRKRVTTTLESGAKYIILDFEPAGYVSTNAVGQTVAIHRAVVESLGELILCGMDMETRATMAKAKLDHLVEHVADQAAAWALVRQRLRAIVTRGCAALAKSLATPPATPPESK